MGVYLQMFEATATAGEWPLPQWCVYLRSALSEQGLVAVVSMAASVQIDYEVVKTTLLRTYHISSETYRKRIFKTHFYSSNTEACFRSFKQDFNQWIETSNRDPLETVLHELALQKLPAWLQFPVARVVLKVKGGEEVEMAVGVSKHIKTDVILGHDVPHFRRYLNEAMKAETGRLNPSQ